MKMHPSIFDVFCCLLGVFMLFNLLTSAYFSESPEKTLPPIDLTSISNDGQTGLTAKDSLTISVKPGKGVDGVQYFIENKSVKLDDIQKRLQETSTSEVLLRVDGEVRQKVTTKLMEICNKNNIHSVSFVCKVVAP